METLQQLAARQAIADVKARYCRYLDTKQWDEFAALFTENFLLDVSEGTGLPMVHGRDEAVAQIRSSIEEAVTVHQVHQPEMRFDESGVQVIWAMQDRVIWSADKPSLVGFGHYHERYVQQGAQWKIASLRLTRLHMEFLAAT